MQGFLLLKKPKGITSFSAVSRIKRLVGERRVGHTGTLDPMATGVLPIFLGKATALCGLLLDGNKRYTAEVKLGITTDTDDITGTVLRESEVNISNDSLKAALEHFKGKIKQKPPIYSALKKDGVRFYDLARSGKTVNIPEREVEVFAIDLLSVLDENNCFTVDVSVSKGTYIRSLARDIGEYLGCGATLTALERTETCGFNIGECTDLDDLDEQNICEKIVSEENAVLNLRECRVTEKQAIRFCNGGQLSFERLHINSFAENELVRVKFGNIFLGIGSADLEKNQLNIKCIINDYKAVAE
ncbi:MAG: tRNA pseudouridine(55) synthase TruB [Clostridia bacterium]|nr:tRNA pseudouridine(55) synthase TruB [Clostridia bacterium]